MNPILTLVDIPVIAASCSNLRVSTQLWLLAGLMAIDTLVVLVVSL